MQGIPRQAQQSLATRVAAREFGRASATAASLRKSLEGLYQQPDAGMNNRLTTQVLRALQHSPGKERLERDIHDGDLSLLQGFQFNNHSPLQEALPVVPQVTVQADGRAEFVLPAFKEADIRYTGEKYGWHSYRLRIVMLSYNFRESYADVLRVENIAVAAEQPEIRLMQPVVLPQGHILLVGMALYAEQDWHTERTLLNSPQWSPAAILCMSHVSQGGVENPDVLQRVRQQKTQQGLPLMLLMHRCARDLHDRLWLQYKAELLAGRMKPTTTEQRTRDLEKDMPEGRVPI